MYTLFVLSPTLRWTPSTSAGFRLDVHQPELFPIGSGCGRGRKEDVLLATLEVRPKSGTRLRHPGKEMVEKETVRSALINCIDPTGRQAESGGSSFLDSSQPSAAGSRS